MGKILQISIYSVLLILVFLFFGSMLKSCGNTATDSIVDTTQKVADNIENAGGEIIAKAESAIDKVGDEFEGGDIDFADSDSNSESKSYQTDNSTSASTTSTTTETQQTNSDDSDDYEPSYVVEDNPAPVTQTVAPKKVAAPKRTSSSAGGSSGRYLLITGNYSQEGNANEMVKKLKNKGFSNAEQVIFEGSRYYTVLAGKYSSMSAANAAKADLGGIDSYVQKRRD